MGMTIDEIIRVISYVKPKKPTSPCGMLKKNAFNTAIDIMRKYQQIKQIVHEWSDIELGSNAEKFMGLIQELVEDADRENGG